MRFTLFLALLLASLCFTGGAVVAAEKGYDAKTAQLEQLRKKITALRNKLDSVRGERNSLRSQLRPVERDIGRLAASLKRLSAKQRAQRKQLAALRSDETQQRKILQDQRRELADQISSSYAMGRQSHIKLLLNQQDISTIGRSLIYFDYFNHARAERIEAIHQQLDRIQALELAIERKVDAIDALRQQQQTKKSALEARFQERKQLLVKLEAEAKDKGQQLARFLADEKTLAGLLEQLRQALADIPAAAGYNTPFAKLKGKLSWPTKGRFAARFGHPRKVGRLKWQGVLIKGREGQDVHAISHGRVAFADWLRGYGLLIIIDHGGGYMSLYGHNQSLYKETGAWVDKGELIAGLGRSGGRSQAALYFEIRRKGNPVNPASWFRANRR